MVVVAAIRPDSAASGQHRCFFAITPLFLVLDMVLGCHACRPCQRHRLLLVKDNDRQRNLGVVLHVLAPALQRKTPAPCVTLTLQFKSCGKPFGPARCRYSRSQASPASGAPGLRSKSPFVWTVVMSRFNYKTVVWKPIDAKGTVSFRARQPAVPFWNRRFVSGDG